MHAGDLALPDVGTLEVGVQQQREAEGVLRAQRVVDADVEVQLLLTEDQPVCKSEPGHTHTHAHTQTCPSVSIARQPGSVTQAALFTSVS